MVGIWGVDGAAQVAALGLHALQHRGQESAGIVSCAEGALHSRRGMGLVATVFGNGEARDLPGASAIGHVRYSTAGGSCLVNAQPLLGHYAGGEAALAHNGNIAAGEALQKELLEHGSFLRTSTDSELFLHLMAQMRAVRDEEIAQVFARAGAAFSVVMLFADRLLAVRDVFGFRPLVLGGLKGGHVVASETCALDQVGATFIREINPGEMLVCDASGLKSLRLAAQNPTPARCLLELIYFARPDSVVFGHTPHIFRVACGRSLAREHPVEADVVVAIPDSGMSAAMGFALESGLPLDRGLIRNHYVGRSFIAPGQDARVAAVRMKHNVVREVVRGKRVVLVDDSLIRGTTTTTLSAELRAAGAAEVHLRIACPPTRHPCLYGVDFPSRDELLAHKHDIQEIRNILDMDSLGYLSLQGLVSNLGTAQNEYCTACWSGLYAA